MTSHARRRSDIPVASRFFTVAAGDESFGLPVDNVQTVFRIGAVTPVPLGPREVVGLVNLRGKIVTSVSLRRRLQLPEAGPALGALAVGLDFRGESFALIVDRVGDVITLPETARIATPSHIEPARARLTAAVFRVADGVLAVLDLAAIFEFGVVSDNRSPLHDAFSAPQENRP